MTAVVAGAMKPPLVGNGGAAARRRAFPALLAVACIALLSSLPPQALAAVEASKTRYVYAAKFICGPSSEAFQEGLVAGAYATAVNILNPSARTVSFEKSIARGLPFQKAGETTEFVSDRIAPGEAIEVECNEIRSRLRLPMSEQFRTGFVVIVSNSELAITAVYSGRPRSGEVTASDIVSIKPFAMPPRHSPFGATGLCRLLEQSASLIEGRVREITFTYDPVIGPRENVSLGNVQTHFGADVGTQLVISNLRGPIPDEPEQTFLEVKEIPHFVRNGHYLIYLSRMPWFYSPVVLDGAYRIETVGTQEVLIDQTGHALNPRPTESAFLVGERVNPTSVFATRPLALKQLFETRIDLDDINAPQPMLPEVDEATVENAFDRAGYLDFVRGAMGKCVEPFTGSLAPSPEAGRVWDVVGVDELADPQIQSDSDVPCGSVDPETGETRVCK